MGVQGAGELKYQYSISLATFFQRFRGQFSRFPDVAGVDLSIFRHKWSTSKTPAGLDPVVSYDVGIKRRTGPELASVIAFNFHALFKQCKLLEKESSFIFVADGTRPNGKIATFARKAAAQQSVLDFQTKNREFRTGRLQPSSDATAVDNLRTAVVNADKKRIRCHVPEIDQHFESALFDANRFQRGEATLLQAKFQADAQLVLLQQNGHISWIFSTDSDLLVLGAPFIVSAFNVPDQSASTTKKRKNEPSDDVSLVTLTIESLSPLSWLNVEPVSQPSISAATIFNNNSDTLLARCTWATILGSDTLPGGIPGIGAITLAKFLDARRRSVNEVIDDCISKARTALTPGVILAAANSMRFEPAYLPPSLDAHFAAAPLQYQEPALSYLRSEEPGFSSSTLHPLNAEFLITSPKLGIDPKSDTEILFSCHSQHRLLLAGKVRYSVCCPDCNNSYCNFCAIDFDVPRSNVDTMSLYVWRCLACRLVPEGADITASISTTPTPIEPKHSIFGGTNRESLFLPIDQQVAETGIDRLAFLSAAQAKKFLKDLHVPDASSMDAEMQQQSISAIISGAMNVRSADLTGKFARQHALEQLKNGTLSRLELAEYVEWPVPDKPFGLDASFFRPSQDAEETYSFLFALTHTMLSADFSSLVRERPEFEKIVALYGDHVSLYSMMAAARFRPFGGAQRLVREGIKNQIGSWSADVGDFEFGWVRSPLGKASEPHQYLLLYVKCREMHRSYCGECYCTEIWISSTGAVTARDTCKAGVSWCHHAQQMVLALENLVNTCGDDSWCSFLLEGFASTMGTTEVLEKWRPQLQPLADYSGIDVWGDMAPGTDRANAWRGRTSNKVKPQPLPITDCIFVSFKESALRNDVAETLIPKMAPLPAEKLRPSGGGFDPLFGSTVLNSSTPVDFSVVMRMWDLIPQPYLASVKRTAGYRLLHFRAQEWARLHPHVSSSSQPNPILSDSRGEPSSKRRKGRIKSQVRCSWGSKGNGNRCQCVPDTCAAYVWKRCPGVSGSQNQAKAAKTNAKRSDFFRDAAVDDSFTDPAICGCHSMTTGKTLPKQTQQEEHHSSITAKICTLMGTPRVSPLTAKFVSPVVTPSAKELNDLSDQCIKSDAFSSVVTVASDNMQELYTHHNQHVDVSERKLKDAKFMRWDSDAWSADTVRKNTKFYCREHMEAFVATLLNVDSVNGIEQVMATEVQQWSHDRARGGVAKRLTSPTSDTNPTPAAVATIPLIVPVMPVPVPVVPVVSVHTATSVATGASSTADATVASTRRSVRRKAPTVNTTTNTTGTTETTAATGEGALVAADADTTLTSAENNAALEAKVKAAKRKSRVTQDLEAERQSYPFLYNNCKKDIKNGGSACRLSGMDQWYLYFFTETKARTVDEVATAFGVGRSVVEPCLLNLSTLYRQRASHIDMLPSESEYNALASEIVKNKYKQHRVIMHDTTNAVNLIGQPTNPVQHNLLYSDYYGGDVYKGGVWVTGCGTTGTLPLWTGGVDDTTYQRHSGAFEKQQQQQDSDPGSKPWLNVFDRGYRNWYDAFLHKQEFLAPPLKSKKQKLYTSNAMGVTAAVASDRQENERVVLRAKHFGFFRRRHATKSRTDLINNIWLNVGHRMNFVYAPL